jgi:hypothetical protein
MSPTTETKTEGKPVKKSCQPAICLTGRGFGCLQLFVEAKLQILGIKFNDPAAFT